MPGDCSKSPPGVRKISLAPVGPASLEVACADDGWTVIQSRGQFGNPIDYFVRKWNSYLNGFGVADIFTNA